MTLGRGALGRIESQSPLVDAAGIGFGRPMAIDYCCSAHGIDELYLCTLALYIDACKIVIRGACSLHCMMQNSSAVEVTRSKGS